MVLAFSRLPDRVVYRVPRPWSLLMRVGQAIGVWLIADTNLRMGMGRLVGSVAATYCLEHLGGTYHSYTWDEFEARYRQHFGTLTAAQSASGVITTASWSGQTAASGGRDIRPSNMRPNLSKTTQSGRMAVCAQPSSLVSCADARRRRGGRCNVRAVPKP